MATSRLTRDLTTLPNLLSLGRMPALWLAIGLYAVGWQLTGLVVGLLAGLADYADGIVARRLNQVTELGAVADQLSDLVFESTGLILGILVDVFPVWVIFAYLFREFAVIAMRLLAAQHGWTLESRIWGKVKTNFLHYTVLVGYCSLLDVMPPEAVPYVRGLALFGVCSAIFLSYASGAIYVRQFARAYEGGE